MAVSVLGKRSRHVLNETETQSTSPSKRRLTRQSVVEIHEDAVEVPQQDVPSRRAVRKRIATSEDKLQDDREIILEQIAVAPSATTDDGKENAQPSFATPTTPRFKDVFQTTPLSTPKHRVRLAGNLITSRSNRDATTPKSNSVYATARQLFTQAANRCQLVGRDSERQRLKHFLAKALNGRKGGCMYVSGPPGTGKSALVEEVFDGFKNSSGVRASFMNCVTEKGTQEVLSKLSDDLQLPSITSGKMGVETLRKVFTSKGTKTMHLVLMDEIDSLLDRDCELLYSLFECAMHRSSSLILVGIANALDLTDRFLPRLQPRNLKPELLSFVPYSATEVSNILSAKLRSLLPSEPTSDANFVPFLHPAAVQLIGKKIASQTGDLRKAFTLARRAIEQAEKDASRQASAGTAATPTKQPLSELANMSRHLPPSPPSSSPLKPLSPHSAASTPYHWTVVTAPRATISHVARLAASIFNTGTTSRLAGLNLQQKAVLCSLVASERRQSQRDPYKTPSKSGYKTATVKVLFEKYAMLCQRDDGLLQPLKNTEFRDVVASLETLGLVHEAVGRSTSLLTPSKTPSRGGRNIDEKHVVSAVSESEMKENISSGAGADLLQRLLDDQ